VRALQPTGAVTLLGQTIRILSAADLALFKLLFFRGKDLVDSVLVLQCRRPPSFNQVAFQ
jgi:hypothetical protein